MSTLTRIQAARGEQNEKTSQRGCNERCWGIYGALWNECWALCEGPGTARGLALPLAAKIRVAIASRYHRTINSENTRRKALS